MKTLHLAGIAAAVVLFGALGSGQKKETEKTRHRSGIAAAPQPAHCLENPYEEKPEAIQAGRKLFDRYCAGCHGSEAQGGRKAPGLRSADVQQALPGDIFWFLTNGDLRRGMPSWSGLPEARRWQLVAYLKSLSEPPAQPRPSDPPCLPQAYP